jgi:nickel-type superoxide dismutase maturation protease
MAPALRHGDHLLVRRAESAEPGCVVVVRLPDQRLAVKRLIRVEADGRLWVEGDNPFGSTDSRSLGALPAASLVGRVVARLWPRPRVLRRVAASG